MQSECFANENAIFVSHLGWDNSLKRLIFKGCSELYSEADLILKALINDVTPRVFPLKGTYSFNDTLSWLTYQILIFYMNLD